MKLMSQIDYTARVMEEEDIESSILLERLKIAEGQLNILDIEIKKILNF